MKTSWMIVPLLLVACATAPSTSPPKVVITESGDELVAPRVVRRVPPDYPRDLRRQGIQGTVTLSANIGLDGVPRQIEIVDSPHPALSQLAADALRKWQFEPATKDGEPVAVEFRITIDFGLRR